MTCVLDGLVLLLCSFTPPLIQESYEGSQPLYEGITFEKDKTFKDFG